MPTISAPRKTSSAAPGPSWSDWTISDILRMNDGSVAHVADFRFK
jgi:hypothetical protein